MGITIHYRGRIADLDRVEEFEDRVVDMALAIGASARVWRSWPDHDPSRVVRGLLLDIAPGQETTSLLISPEGWLLPLFEIEAAEKGPADEPPICFVKTQFGSVEGHVPIVALFTYLKQEFFPDLWVQDESGYWEHRDVKRLAGKLERLRALISQFGDALRAHSLTDEAAEDRSILVARIERVAHLVHQSLARPPEHPPVVFDDAPTELSFDDQVDELDERRWDEFFKQQQRQYERLKRAIDENVRGGLDDSSALEKAIRDEIVADWPGEADESAEESADEMTYRMREEERDDALGCDSQDQDDLEARESSAWSAREQHPLRQFASNLFLRCVELFREQDTDPSSHSSILFDGMAEVCGGVAQSLWKPDAYRDPHFRGLAVAQLKRALRGVAFAHGALYPLRAASRLSAPDFEEIKRQLLEIQQHLAVELARFRNLDQ